MADQLSGTATPNSSFNTPAPTPQTFPNGFPRKRKLTHPCPWPNCDRWLSCPHNVQQHIREKHTHEKPFRCNLCTSAFSRPYTLYRHLEHKHGIAGAAPGRGKGVGLERIGMEIERVKKRKKGEEKGKGKARQTGGLDEGKVVMGGESGGSYPHEETGYGAHNTLRPHPQSIAKEGFALNNFTPIPTSCTTCNARFENREALLAHLHTDHGAPSSAQCDCMLCLGRFEGEVDAAGVHVRETGAMRMRGMMAGDLFPFEGDETVGGAPATAVTKAEKAATDRQDVKRALARLGMTEEQFTANLPKGDPRAPSVSQPATPGMPSSFTGNAANGSGSAAQAPFSQSQQPLDMSAARTFDDTTGEMAEFDDVDEWLRSAEEVFGGADALGKYPDMNDARMGGS